jgi:two-component system chemotaxis sensor kinase CheA
VEMPRMNGLAFAAEVRSDPRWKDIPMVALSTRAGKEDIAEALRAGFDTYVSKSSRDTLLNTLSGLLAANSAEAAAPASVKSDDDAGFRAA